MNKRRWRMAARGFIFVVLAAVAGCGPNLGAASKVTGKVTLDGEPLSDATVTFQATGDLPAEHRTKQATTSGDGSYELTQVYPAEYQVIVFPSSPSPSPGTEADPGSLPATAGEEIQPASGEELRVNVSGDTTYDIQLTKARR